MPDHASTDAALLPYPKISAKGLGDAHGGREWVATEKVHGAHFAVRCDGVGVRAAKRREVLGDDALDGFFGVSRIWPALSVAAGRCGAALLEAAGPEAAVTLYGELAGGHYPHPDVPSPDAQPVQTGVWYAPNLFWLLFDALVEDDGRRWWVADRMLRAAADAAGLACVPMLGHGSPQRLRELPSLYPTSVPALFGLPAIEGNHAEGYVLKPAGQWEETGARPLLKVKQEAFAEDERFAGARPYIAPPQGAAGVPAWLVAQATTLLTPTRAAAAVSKLGPETPVRLVAQEIADDAAAELSEEIGGLEPAQLVSLVDVLLSGAFALAEFDAVDRRVVGTSR